MLEPARPELRVAGTQDLPEVARSLAAAFDGYPLTEWVVLRDADHAARRRRYFEILLRHGVEYGDVLCSEDLAAAAIWYPPDGWNAGMLTLLARLPAFARVTGWRNLASRLRQLARLAGHHPPEPHWYLELIGAHPDAQHRGLGSALLEAGLERAAAQGVGAYVVTSSPAAIPLYEAHGFALRDELAIPTGPTCWCLWRDR
jgi:ribosomal protein S18 acetylase RimI-like enzyme